MSRAVLTACGPWFCWMAIAFLLAMVVVRLSGARWNLPRLRSLHHCQEGSVQTVSFVLTLPVFIMVMLFVVQVSQLMIGITVVHYAAFAAARSASVWFAADLPQTNEPANQLDPRVPYQMFGENWVYPAQSLANPVPSGKLRKIWLAAVEACAPISPSRDLYMSGGSVDNPLGAEAAIMNMLYGTLSPTSRQNSRINARIQNKMAYAAHHTRVLVSGTDRVAIPQGDPIHYGPTYDVDYSYDPPQRRFAEIGSEDPITVTVQHEFALLPGPARLLANRLVNSNGQPDNVSGRIFMVTGNNLQEKVYATLLSASLTMTSEGLKSVIPYVEHPE